VVPAGGEEGENKAEDIAPKQEDDIDSVLDLGENREYYIAKDIKKNKLEDIMNNIEFFAELPYFDDDFILKILEYLNIVDYD